MMNALAKRFVGTPLLVGLALIFVSAITVFLYPTRNIPILYAVPLLIAALRLSPKGILVTGGLAVALNLISVAVERTPIEVWPVTILALLVVCYSAFLLGRQREQTKRQTGEVERERDRARESEMRLNRTQEISHLGSWELDVVQDRLTWSDESYRIFGLKPQEFAATYEAFLDRVHPDDRAAVDAAYISSLRENRDTYEIEHRVVGKSDGEVRFVHEKCEHFRDATGQIVRSIGMTHDITERKRSEAALRESEERFATFMDNSPTLAWMKDEEGRYAYLSRSYQRALGTERVDRGGLTDFDLWPELLAREHRASDLAVLSRAESIQVVEETRGPDGETRYWLDTKFPFRDASGKRYVGGIGLDVTEQKRAEAERERLLAELRLANDRLTAVSAAAQESAARAELQAGQLSALIANLSDGITILDASGRVILRNDALRELTRTGDEQVRVVQGYRATRLLYLDGGDVPEEMWPATRLLRGERVVDEEFILELADGSRKRVVTSGSTVADSEGRVALAIVVARDVTELRELEQEREEYLRAISHDLRNPLSSILGCAQVSQRLADNPDYVRRCGELIAASAKLMNRMLTDLSEAARLEAGQLRFNLAPIDLPSLLFDLRDQFASADERAGERIELQIDEALPPVLADRDALARVVTNLLSNALKYGGDGPVAVRPTREDGHITLSVKDQGSGIAPEHLSRIFERYFRTASAERHEGLGLGLYITRGLIEGQGGRIWVDSEVGIGSTFAFTLPLA